MNNENNINGIPNVNDIKIEETPAESFASIYGNGVQPSPAPQAVPPVQPAPAPQAVPPVQPAPAPQAVPPVQPAPAPQAVPPVQPAPVPQPVPPVQPAPVQPAPPVQPTPQVVEPIQPVQVDADRLQSIEEQLSKTSQYKPEDFQQEKIEIPTTSEYEKNKSGLSFVIVLSIILGLVIFALPFITKYFS